MKYSIYETFEYGHFVRLCLDLDIVNDDIPKNEDRMEYFDKIIRDATRIINKKLKRSEDNLGTPQIIIDDACNDIKLSGHVIYKNMVFEDISLLRRFMHGLKEEYKDKKEKYLFDNEIIDLHIYDGKTLRLPKNCKYGKTNYLKFYKGINYDNIDDETLFYDSMVIPQYDDFEIVNLYEIEYEKDKIIKKIKIPKLVVKDTKNYTFENKIPLEQIQKYVNLLSRKRCTDYGTRLEIGCIIKNCNSNGLYIFDCWSKLTTKDNYNKIAVEAQWAVFIQGIKE